MKITHIPHQDQLPPYIEELSPLLQSVVEGGASIGFLPPLSQETAKEYWNAVIKPGVLLYVATIDQQIAGTVQLHLSNTPNGKHRAEVCKLMTHPHFRKQGVARALMLHIETVALEKQRTLLTLDTREGDPSNLLYRSLGYIEAGKIPGYARSANGELHATVLYYKQL